jgi:hypothetical protein
VRKVCLHRSPIKAPNFVRFQRYIVSFCCNQRHGWSAASTKPWEHKSPDPVALKHWLAGVFYWLARHTWRQPPRYSHSQTSCCVSWLHWFLFVSSLFSPPYTVHTHAHPLHTRHPPHPTPPHPPPPPPTPNHLCCVTLLILITDITFYGVVWIPRPNSWT